MIDQEPVRRGRPPKVETNGEGRRPRRRKDGETEVMGLRLPIPDGINEKFPKSEYRLRWFRDEPGRLHRAYQNDWDAVEGVAPVPGAHDANGNPCNHILCVKYQDWWLQDRAKAEERRKVIEDQAVKGAVAGKGDDAGAGLRSEVSYADASNRLR